MSTQHELAELPPFRSCRRRSRRQERLARSSARAICLIVVIGASLFCVSSVGASSFPGTVPRAKTCGQVSAAYPDVEGGSVLELIDVRRISCGRARRVVYRCIRRYHLPGWSAHYDRNVIGHLQKGQAHIAKKGIAGGGLHCIPDPFSQPSHEAARQQFRSCGHVGSSVGGGYGSIRAYGLSCSAARRVIRSSMRGEPHGWTFIPGSGRDEYRKAGKRITGVPLGD